MAEGDRDPTDNLDPRYFPTGAVIERAVAERPKHDTVDGIIDWLAGPAQHIPSLGDEFDEFAWRLVGRRHCPAADNPRAPHTSPSIPWRDLCLVANHWPHCAEICHARSAGFIWARR